VVLPPFQELVDAHWRDVARLAHALAGPNDGEDCAQRVWVQALEAYPRLESARNLRGWLLTITRHAAIDGHRSRARQAVPVAEPGEVSAAARMATGHDAGLPSEQDPELWAAVRALPERQRVAVALRYVLDLDHAEIARHLDTTTTMSRRLVSDGLSQLRKEIHDE